MSSTEAEPRLSQPHTSTASLGAKVAGVTLFGVTVKTYQNLIQKRHPLSGGRAHLINAGVWAGIGYLWYYAEQRQQQLLYKIDSAKLGAREAPRGEGQSNEQGTALPS